MNGTSSWSARSGCLDMLRGMAMAGMILVNNPGSWHHMFPWLRHAGWSGCRAADLVLPCFIFVAGAALAFSLAGHAHTGRLTPGLAARIGRRTLLLFLLGLFLNALPGLLQWLLYGAHADFSTLRIMGVLQRISIVYCAAALCVIFLSPLGLRAVMLLILLGYWAVLSCWPGPLSPEHNPALTFDRMLLGAGHLYRGGLDPEGVFSTIAALATALLGYEAGRFVRLRQHAATTSLLLACAGAAWLACGYAWSTCHPLCKDLWTGPYTLVAAGWACLCLGLCHGAVEVLHMNAAAMPLQVMGRNPLFLFAASALLARVLQAVTIHHAGAAASLWAWLYDAGFASWLGRTGASSFAFSACYLAAWWLVLYAMDRRALHIKL